MWADLSCYSCFEFSCLSKNGARYFWKKPCVPITSESLKIESRKWQLLPASGAPVFRRADAPGLRREFSRILKRYWLKIVALKKKERGWCVSNQGLEALGAFALCHLRYHVNSLTKILTVISCYVWMYMLNDTNPKKW